MTRTTYAAFRQMIQPRTREPEVIYYHGTEAVNTALNTLLFRRGGHTDLLNFRTITDASAVEQTRGPYYVSVLLNLVGWNASLRQFRNRTWRPGHASIMLWDADQYTYATSTITYDPDNLNATQLLQPEFTWSESFRGSDSLSVWFYTREITRQQLRNMVQCIRNLQPNAIYREFTGWRYRNTFNCATYVDRVLESAGAASFFSTNLSWGVNPLSWGTPFMYSESFSRLYWSCGYIPNRTTF